ncbi:hypothetical protein [Luteipulveratus halotolerans]|uniref:Uncharacterized protein n=1 Tax=Luteipulveratus halotolerans TaxID=1631356 RepID=A0A0L6CGV5_9MICO|nr:hypothetical protein [Luteipulveratus halotolerans]KNX36753.1 hypothetical protein VV01_05700 [Luteipulveratus halotolerans]
MRTGRCVLVLAAVTLAGVLFWVAVGIGVYHHRSDAAPAQQEKCTERIDVKCTDIPLAKIEKASHLDLPDGTQVLESSYTRFQDWQLTATVRLPAGSASPVDSPAAEPYYGADGPGPDGAYYKATQRHETDGRLVIELEIFTT